MKKLIAFVFCGVAFCLPLSSFAIGDAAVVAQLIKNLTELKKQYSMLEKQYGVLNEQYDSLKMIRDNGIGSYGYGGLLNGANDLNQREWSPNSWQNALKGLAGNNPQRYQQLMTLYQQNHPTLNETDYQKGASKTNAKTYENEVNTNRAATVQASYTFNDIQKHLQDVHTLSQKIDSTKNTKAALDLNNRLLTELSYIAVQELKMQAVLSEEVGSQQGTTIDDKTAAATFNQLPKE